MVAFPTQRHGKIISRLIGFVVLLAFMLASAPGFSQAKSAKEVKKAKEHIGRKEYDQALVSLTAALDHSKGKDDYKIFYLKGHCHYHLNQYPKAIEQLNFALSKVNSKAALPKGTDEHILMALLYRALTYEALDNRKDAITSLQLLATSENPGFKSLAYEKWARNWFELDNKANHERAELIIAQAIKVNPNNASAWAYQAQLAMHEHGYEEAANSLKTAISLEANPYTKASYYSMLGLCYYKTGQIPEALSTFKGAVDMAPESTKWKIYQQQAALVINHQLYNPEMLAQGKLWANRAAILSEDCGNNLTFAHMLVLNNELAEAKKLVKTVPDDCSNPNLRLTKAQLSTLIDDLVAASNQNTRLVAYGNHSYYYWGNKKAGMAEGSGRATSKNFLYEVTHAKFVKGELVSGTLTNVADGWKYTGAFKAGKMTGTGTIKYRDGESYSGRFVGNKPNGTGKWEYANGSTYAGNFVDGTPEGAGVYKGTDGTAYEGQFRKGKPHGKGFITVNGKKEAAEFTNGTRTDAAYLAQQQAVKEKLEQDKKASEALAIQRMKEEELAKAERRNNAGKIIGKSLLLAGGTLALTEAVNAGMSQGDATELGVALLSDIITDGKESNFVNTVNAKAMTGQLGNNSALSNAAASMNALNASGSGNAAAASTGTDASARSGAGVTGQNGTYTTSDGYYSINVTFNGSTLTVKEPNKVSTYNLVGGSVYAFTNPTNRIEYRMQVMDATTLAAFKPQAPNNKTMLYFTGAINTPPTTQEFNQYMQMAEHYKAKMNSDPKDAQLWAFCAQAANARSTMNEDGFNDYAAKLAASMKQIVTNTSRCPCEDALPASIWNSVR